VVVNGGNSASGAGPGSSGAPTVTVAVAGGVNVGEALERKLAKDLTRKRQLLDVAHARLDLLFLLLFPIFFLIFNAVYWVSFLYGECEHCNDMPGPSIPHGIQRDDLMR
jgi:hypothetical protein